MPITDLSGSVLDLPKYTSGMVDLSDKLSSDSEEMNSKYPEVGSSSSSEESQTKKTCADCGTSKTPLWRGGPAGPKSLCNACGIRSRKKRRAILGINTKSEEKKPLKKTNHSSNSGSLNHKLLSFGKEVFIQRSRMEKHWRKLGEEEQAAVLLMALSYGSVYA